MQPTSIRSRSLRASSRASLRTLGVLLCTAGPLLALGSDATALSITASAVGDDFEVGSTTTLSLSLQLDEGEVISALEVSVALVGIEAIGSFDFTFDPLGLFTDIEGNLEGNEIRLAYTRDNSDSAGVIAEIEFTWTQPGAVYVVLDEVSAYRDLNDPPHFEAVPGDQISGTPLLTLGEPAPFETIREDFAALANQSDSTGTQVGNDTLYLIEEGGDPVASLEGALAQGAAVTDGGGGKVWLLSSEAGSTVASDGILLMGDLPALLDGPRSGGFAEGFSEPRNLIGATLTARVRKASGAGATQMRAVLLDSESREIASNLAELGDAFSDYPFQIHEDFSELVGAAAGFHFTEVTGIALEFHTDLVDAPAFEFRVDSVEIVPEPNAALLTAGALATLAAVYRTRRRKPNS